MTIERPENDLGYHCGHCDECVSSGWGRNGKWATYKEQANNTNRNHMIEWSGRVQSITAWAKEIGIHHISLLRRIRAHGLEKAMTMPVKRVGPRVKIMFNGVLTPLAMVASAIGVTPEAIRARMKKKDWTMDMILAPGKYTGTNPRKQFDRELVQP
jgi:hypothetical protein